MIDSPPTRRLSPIERRILEAVKQAVRDGEDPKSVYLTPDDHQALTTAIGPADAVAGLAIRRKAKGSSILYCRHGISRVIRKRGALE